MYQYLKGIVVEKGLDYAVIEVADIGYFLAISAKTSQNLTIGEKTKIYTKLLVREDAHSLCGFYEINEREFFEHLISVSGIGQRVAMNMISKADYTAILGWIISADEKNLTKLPGLGKKTAQRLIVELRDKFKKLYGSDISSEQAIIQNTANQYSEDVYLALTGLGFKRDEIAKMLTGIDIATLSIEQIIKYALKQSRS